MDLYFQRHDGQAVTCDEFAQAMQDASGVDLSRFKRWYDQAGTPTLDIEGVHDAAGARYRMTVRQSCAPTPGQPEKLPLHIPLALGLVGPDGRDIPLTLEGEAAGGDTTRVLSVTEATTTFTFVDVPAKPVPSIARGFSAPVKIRFPYTADELTHLIAYDSDAFNRWEAGQRLAADLMLANVSEVRAGREPRVPESFIAAFGRVLADAGNDPAFAAEALALPSEGFLAELMDEVDPDAIHRVRLDLRRQIASALRSELQATYEAQTVPGAYSPDAASAGKRALRNTCLAYLTDLDDAQSRTLAMRQFETANNMTDSVAALGALAQLDCPERRDALAVFYERWKHEALVMDKWLGVQSTSRLPGTLAEVRALMGHPAFDLRNPNKVRALISSFCHANPVRFHAADGSGYAFCAEQVIALDALNPQVAARLARAFDRWKKFDAGRQARARTALERIRAVPQLSKDTLEVVTRALS
jgi:aminopeptidase N